MSRKKNETRAMIIVQHIFIQYLLCDRNKLILYYFINIVNKFKNLLVKYARIFSKIMNIMDFIKIRHHDLEISEINKYGLNILFV